MIVFLPVFNAMNGLGLRAGQIMPAVGDDADKNHGNSVCISEKDGVTDSLCGASCMIGTGAGAFEPPIGDRF